MTKERKARRREENEIEFSRIVAFSDGVFAIAITLLVLNLSVPEHIHGDDLNAVLWDQRQDVLAYALSFAIIGRFWIIHHRFFGSVVSFDARLLGLNLLYLGWIAFFPFSAGVFGDHAGDSAAVVLYAINLAAIALVGQLMVTDARQDGLSEMSEREAREGRHRALAVAVVFLVSIPVALLNPHVAPFLWLLLFVDSAGRRLGRTRASG